MWSEGHTARSLFTGVIWFRNRFGAKDILQDLYLLESSGSGTEPTGRLMNTGAHKIRVS
jgi:hypothetical protein